MDTTLRALNRFGLGARLGERDVVRDGEAWLRAQLDAAPARLNGGGLDEIGDVLRALREAQRTQEPARLRPVVQQIQDLRARELSAVLTERVTTDTPFQERLVTFWSNHLCVSLGASRQVSALASHYSVSRFCCAASMVTRSASRKASASGPLAPSATAAIACSTHLPSPAPAVRRQSFDRLHFGRPEKI